jgi:tight adherence protein C
MADLLAGLLDASNRPTAELRLRQAGIDATVDQYRIRQLGYTIGGISAGLGTGMLLDRSAGVVLLIGLLAGFPAATHWRNRVQRAIRDRASRMRLELATICQVLAVHIRTGHGPVEAVTLVTRRARGPVADELTDALGWITAGLPASDAYSRIAVTTPEPAAARLYRTLAASSGTNANIAEGLLVLADDVRAERREELARHAIRRRNAMLLPLLTLIAPVMLLFVAAALPSIVFGR